MIFVSLGTQKFQLDRLLKEIDFLIENGIIIDNVFAQTGYSKYIPQNYDYENFLTQEKFNEYIESADILITHGGVGTITSGLSKNKRIIVFPRLEQYGEHVDNHQLEIAHKFSQLGYVLSVDENCALVDCVKKIHFFAPAIFSNNEGVEKIIEKITLFIDQN